MKEKLHRFFLTAPIKLLIGIPFLVVVILWFIAVMIPETNANTETIKLFLIVISFFFGGCMGIPMIIRKEAPFTFGNEEKATIQGYSFLLGGWGIMILFAISFLFLR